MIHNYTYFYSGSKTPLRTTKGGSFGGIVRVMVKLPSDVESGDESAITNMFTKSAAM